MLKSRRALVAVSLLAAIVLWLYVTGEVDPDMRGKVTGIPVYITGADVLDEYGLAPVYEETIEVNADVYGNRSDVNKAKRDGLSAYVDVSECDEGKNKAKINVNLPDGLSLESLSQSTMNVNVEAWIKDVKPVDVKFIDADMTGEEVPVILDYSPETVYVSGALSSVKRVDRVIGKINPKKADSESKLVNVQLKAVDEDGNKVNGVTLDHDTIEVEIQKMPAKTVGLQLTVEDDDQLIKQVLPSTVKIAADEESIKEIDKVEGTVSVDSEGRTVIHVNLPNEVYLLIGEDNGKIIWN